MPRPIDKNGLEQLIANGKANPKVIKTLKCKTVAEGKFRHANYIRNLPPYIVDEPPGLLGDDTAPNPSEASLAALGSCLAVGLHANAVHRGWIVNKLELELEGDLNITAVWGTGDVGQAGRLHRRARQGRHGMRGDLAGRDQCAGHPCEAMVAGRQHLHPPGQSRGRHLRRRQQDKVRGTIMGSLALSRAEVLDQPAPSIAGRGGADCAGQLAPLAAGIDAGTVYPAEVLRKFGEVGAWGSHVPHEGPADLRCAIQAMAAIGEVCGSTAFMAWCQNTLVWYAANSTNMKLAKRFGDGSRPAACSVAPGSPIR